MRLTKYNRQNKEEKGNSLWRHIAPLTQAMAIAWRHQAITWTNAE